MSQGQQQIVSGRVFSRPIAYQHDINLDEPFYEAGDWRYEVDVIRNASPNDIINLHINGPGGSLHTCSAILKAMAETPARIVGHLSGLCASAHTLVFLSCDEYVVGDDAEFMIHSSSSGYSGKETELFQYAQHYNKTNRKLMEKYYKHILTPEELEACINGRDFWFDAEELMDRLSARRSAEEDMALEGLGREELQQIAKQVGVKFTPKTSTERLRTMLKEALNEKDDD